jgi:hypothetical protein
LKPVACMLSNLRIGGPSVVNNDGPIEGPSSTKRVTLCQYAATMRLSD